MMIHRIVSEMSGRMLRVSDKCEREPFQRCNYYTTIWQNSQY